ncbi:MAG: recombinase family protein [Ruminococcus sp.]|uniref:recombinase family protein n=1 Tax=Ruminococcus sp. TaxID=41978 RepID=UPI0025F09DBC|nr:recombinase family protein [Ruminococcus sp.]MCR5599524.1 recombinase family protein [Ruminococcus sp.]
MKEVITIAPVKSLFMPKKRVAAYARVSVNNDPMMRSVEAQVSYYSKLIQSNPDWIYAGVYADKGISGTGIKQRHSFQEMIQACEEGSIDIILCKSISRFARNTVDLLNTIRHLRELGVEVQFEKEHISSLSKEGEFMLTILASFAQEESRSISENVKWGIRKRYAKGEYTISHQHVLGYRYDPELKNYVIIPEEAAIVREIITMYLDGKSTGDILKKLKAEGKQTTFGKQFEYERIHVILSNEIYTGNRLLQKSYVESHLTKKQKKNKGELPQFLCSGTHEAIIDQETFDRVQEEKKRRGKFYADRYLGYHPENGKYVLDPVETEYVKWIFKKYLEHIPLLQIESEMNKMGVRTHREKNFRQNTIANIVQNDFYAPDNPDVNEHLFDEETYEKIMAERKFREKHKPKNHLNGKVPVSNKRILGYQFDDELGRYMIVPEEAEIIREIFLLFLEGTGTSEIAKKLNAEGKRTTFGALFDGQRIDVILDFEVYTGDLLLQKFHAEGDIQKKRNRGELPQYLFTDVHEAIIDRDTFRLAQEERKRRGEMYRNHVLGYRLENGSVVVDPVGAETVRYIFKLYLDHEEYTAIAAELNAKGYKTVRDRAFTNKTAQAVIVNDFYDPANPAVTESILDSETYESIKAEHAFRAAHKYGKGMQKRILGYKKKGTGFVIDPHEAEAVRLAFRMYLEHAYLVDIADALYARGYRTIKGHPFIHISVRNMVLNDCYDPEFPAVAEPILDKGTYEKVRAERRFREEHQHRKGLKLK